MTTVGVTDGINVVLQQVDLATDALVGKLCFSLFSEFIQDDLARAVVRYQLRDRIALSGGVLRVASDIEVHTTSIGGENVGCPVLSDHRAEHVAGNLIRSQTARAIQRQSDAELGLNTGDASGQRLCRYRCRRCFRLLLPYLLVSHFLLATLLDIRTHELLGVVLQQTINFIQQVVSSCNVLLSLTAASDLAELFLVASAGTAAENLSVTSHDIAP